MTSVFLFGLAAAIAWTNIYLGLKRPRRDLASRRIVWSALSDLFLDTDTRIFEDGVAKTLAASPYSLWEIECILSREICPVCGPVLGSMVGEWAAFDTEWLEKSILKGRHLRMACTALVGGNLYTIFSPQWHRVRYKTWKIRRGSL